MSNVTHVTKINELEQATNPQMNLVQNSELTRVATYRRRIGASWDRVWENVLDWEHLPWVHSKSFCDITCHEAGTWGWRAQVCYPGSDRVSRLELLVDEDAGRYVTRVLTGPGEGGEIWTSVCRSTKRQTDIVVEFCLAVPSGVDAQTLGEGYLTLYARLWDEDECMMQQRQVELDRLKCNRAKATAGVVRAQGGDREQAADVADGAADSIELGTLAEVRSRLPLDIDAFGARMRIVDLDRNWFVHSLTCPHSLGPLDQSELIDGELQCPWHGYRFDLRTGRSCDGHHLQLGIPARLEIDIEGDRVRLLRTGSHHKIDKIDKIDKVVDTDNVEESDTCEEQA